MRKNAKVDANQKEIVKALRAAGATVTHTHAIGKGFPDICVGLRGVNYLMEIKDGSKPKSAQALTNDEHNWHVCWRGQVAIIRSVDEALDVIAGNGRSQGI